MSGIRLNPEYLKANSDREADLERTIVVACTPVLDRTIEGAQP